MKNLYLTMLVLALAACSSYREDVRYEPPSFPKEYTAQIKSLNKEEIRKHLMINPSTN